MKDKKTLEELDAWSSILVRTGTHIIRQRKQFIETFDEYVNQSYNVVMEGEEKPGISYMYLEGYIGNKIEGEFENCYRKK